jgi:hypothetical protein
MSSAFYRDTVVYGKSVHEYSIKVSDEQWLGANTIEELVNIVLSEGICPSKILYVDGQPSNECITDFIVE